MDGQGDVSTIIIVVINIPAPEESLNPLMIEANVHYSHITYLLFYFSCLYTWTWEYLHVQFPSIHTKGC